VAVGEDRVAYLDASQVVDEVLEVFVVDGAEDALGHVDSVGGQSEVEHLEDWVDEDLQLRSGDFGGDELGGDHCS